jgi:hypothetical protein
MSPSPSLDVVLPTSDNSRHHAGRIRKTPQRNIQTMGVNPGTKTTDIFLIHFNYHLTKGKILFLS